MVLTGTNGSIDIGPPKSPWQNAANPLDVNHNASVTPIDALIIINYLNSNGSQVLTGSPAGIDPYYDVNGDGKVTPIDALTVINFLNSQNLTATQAAKPAAASTASRAAAIDSWAAELGLADTPTSPELENLLPTMSNRPFT